MTLQRESSDRGALVAIDLAPIEAVAAVRSTWDDGDAVFVVDRSLGGDGRRRMIDAVRPTRIIDETGVHDVGAGDVERSIAAVVATSGTDADPKLVELGWSAMAHSARAYVDRLRLDEGDSWAVTLPLSGVGGLAIVARAHVTGIAAPVYDTTVDAIDAGSTVVSLVPTMAQRLLDTDAALDRLGCAVVGGAPLSDRIRAGLEKRGLRVVQSYGMTETWGGAFLDGIGIEGITAHIALSGRIAIAGPVLFTRYRFDEAATSGAWDADGGFATGDIGHFEDDRLVIDGRVDDLILTGGVSIQPSHVEAVIAGLEGVVDVCVAGVPSDEWGQEVVAFVVVDGNRDAAADRIGDAVRSALAAAAVPKRVIRVPFIPRNANGKPLRRRIISDFIGSTD